MWSISYPGYNLVNILTCILWTWNLSQSDCKKLFLKEGTVFLKSYNAAIQLVISCKQVIQFALYIPWCQQLSNRVVRSLKVQSGSPHTSRQLMCEHRVSEISNKTRKATHQVWWLYERRMSEDFLSKTHRNHTAQHIQEFPLQKHVNHSFPTCYNTCY